MFERSQLSSRPEVIQSLRWTKLPVLDDGFVCLVDIMGDDAAVVQAAKVSYGKDARDKQCCERDYDNDGRCDVHPQGLTLEQRDTKNRTLLRYLMRHRHSTPFEMAELKFLVRVPMDCWRQWIRHRMASVNEYSTRYTDAIDSAQGTGPTEWRNQSKSNKQGSGTDGITEWPKGYEWKEQKPPIPLPED